MPRTPQLFAIALATTVLTGCGAEEEMNVEEQSAALTEEFRASDCAAENAVAKVSQSVSMVEELPEDHPQYAELRDAASNLVDTFNRVDTAGDGRPMEETVAEVCSAYDEFAEIARSADLME